MRVLVIFAIVAGLANAEAPKLDRLGSPLPPGAIVRYGDASQRGGYVDSVNFSPDGKLLLRSRFGRSEIVDLATGKDATPDFFAKLSGYQFRLLAKGRCAAWSGPGIRQQCEVYDLATGKRLYEFKPKENHGLSSVATTPDGFGLVISTYASTNPPIYAARAIDLSGDEPIAMEASDATWASFAFGPDRKRLYCCNNSEIRVLEFPSGKVLDTVDQPAGMYSSLFLSPSGDVAAIAASNTSNIFIGKIKSGVPIDFESRGQHAFNTMGGLLTSDGKKFVIGGSSEWIDAATGEKNFPKSDHKRTSLTQNILSNDGRFVLDIIDGRQQVVWDVATGKTIRKFDGLEDPSQLLFDGKDRLVMLDKTCVVRTFDLATGEPKEILVKRKTEKPQETLAQLLDDDCRLVEFSRSSGALTVTDASTGKELLKLEHRLAGTAANFNLRPDLERVLVNVNGQTAAVSLKTGQAVRQIPEASYGAYYSPDGKSIIAIGASNFTIIETATNKVRQTVSLMSARNNYDDFEFSRRGRVNSIVNTIRFTEDGRTMAMFHTDGRIGVWNLDELTPKAIDAFPGRQTGSISPDGRWLVSASMDSAGATLRDLDEADASKGTIRLQGISSPVRSVEFTSDGKRFATAHADGLALLWDVEALKKHASKIPEAPSGEAIWADLASDRPAIAHKAIQLALKHPEIALATFESKLLPVAEPPAKQVADWIDDLAHSDYGKRKSAEIALTKLRELASESLEAALKATDVHERAEAIRLLLVKSQSVELDPERIRAFRAIELLERLRSSKSLALLKVIAGGAKRSQITQDAKASVQRLEKSIR